MTQQKRPKDTSPNAANRPNAPFRSKPESIPGAKEKKGVAVRQAAIQQKSNGKTRKKIQ
jgi:hypothetical protein